FDGCTILHNPRPSVQTTLLAGGTFTNSYACPLTDATNPATVTGLAIDTPTVDGELDLSWSATTDNVAVWGYQLNRTGGDGPVTIDVGDNLTYNDTGLNNGTEYTYTVQAYDLNYNESTASASATETTTGAAGGAAPTYNSDVVASYTTSNTSAHTVSLPASITEGDLIVIGFAVNKQSNWGSATGYSTITQAISGASLTVLYKIAGASEGSSVTVTSSLGARGNYHAMTFSGVDQTTPLVSSSGSTGTGSSNCTPPAVTVNSDELLVAIMGLDGTSADYITAVPSNMTMLSVSNNYQNLSAFCGSAYMNTGDGTTFTPTNFTHTTDGWGVISVVFAGA
ncbi:hypothetical protein OAG36_01125, partial [bacterium]|nr:hypothetical protein [bacterium]